MPKYVYLCEDCGNESEIIHPYNDTPIIRCPKCQGKTSRKLFPALLHIPHPITYEDIPDDTPW